MENKQRIMIFSSFLVLALLATAIFFPRKPDEAENVQYIAAMESIKDTQLGKLSPSVMVDMTAFLDTVIPYLTFEHGEDPVSIALKQEYIDKLSKDNIRRNDALAVLFKIIGQKIPPSDKILEKAIELNIITEKDKSLHDNNKLSASEASYLIVKTKSIYYSLLEKDTNKKDIDILRYYYNASDFIFSEDGRILWYNDEGGALNALNTADGSFSVITKPESETLEVYNLKEPGNIINIYDNDNILRAVSVEKAIKPGYVTDKYILYRDNITSQWTKIVEFDLGSSRQFEIVGFTEDNNKMYVKTNLYDNYITLYEIDPNTKSRQVVWKNKNADIADSVIAKSIGLDVTDLFHPVTGKLLSTIYVNDKPRLLCLDEAFKSIMVDVSKDLGDNIFPIKITKDLKYVVLMHKDCFDLGTYYLYNTVTRTHKLLSTPGIDEESLGITFPVSFISSDGETIYGYITIPKGKTPENLPLVVNVHSGQMSRFSWSPTAETILASNKGYAVLSVNSRLSAGYGNEYIDSVTKDLLLPQKDIYEMTQWIIDLGVVDKNKVTIMGYSYGGYSALYQAGVHPEMYKAAISLMGIWNWNTLGHEFSDNNIYPEWYLRFAPLPGSELATFMSPSNSVNNIKCPVLIIYSGKDDIVYPSQNTAAISDLTLTGNKPDTLFLQNSKHELTDMGELAQVLSKLESFLNNDYVKLEQTE